MDPISLAIATGIASKGSELAIDHGSRAWRRLTQIVKERLRRDHDGSELLQGSALTELGANQINHLSEILTALRQRDRGFDEQLRGAWQEVIDLRRTDGQVNNMMTGTAGGHVIQAGHISGGVTLGKVHPLS
ncbi:hypothetical protein [Micromonospora sp. NPDC048868]|uniref:hypothetical protein n=1 Tax=unclassified Micromonospora TaxID=2617518 RepID=UPI00371E1774